MTPEFDLEKDTASTVTIVSEKHCWRTLGGLRTRNHFLAREAIADGCHLQEITFLLRHPEVMLCDLSNLEEPLSRCTTEAIEMAYEDLQMSVREALDQRDQRVITGDGLQPELAISGRSKSELLERKTQILSALRARIGPTLPVVHDPRRARGIARTQALSQASERVQEIYNDFCSFYGQFITPAHWVNASALTQRLLYDDHLVWSQIAALAENKLFIVSAGLSLGLAFTEWTGDERIHFTEVHRQNDPTMLERVRAFDSIYPALPAQAGSWVVIDKAYTGGSIRLAAQRLRQHVGYHAPIFSVALFPKSLEAVASADYVVYAGRLIRVRDVIGRLTPTWWHIELLRMGSP